MSNTDNARNQALSQYEGIFDMVERVRHAETCTEPETCDIDIKEVTSLLGYSLQDMDEAELRELYHDEESAREAIQEDPLSVQVRTGWHTPGDNVKADEYEILLCTGGPAVRIIGDLDKYQEPSNATLEYQDWSTPWTEYPLNSGQKETLLDYARSFYFGE